MPAFWWVQTVGTAMRLAERLEAQFKESGDLVIQVASPEQRCPEPVHFTEPRRFEFLDYSGACTRTSSEPGRPLVRRVSSGVVVFRGPGVP